MSLQSYSPSCGLPGNSALRHLLDTPSHNCFSPENKFAQRTPSNAPIRADSGSHLSLWNAVRSCDDDMLMCHGVRKNKYSGAELYKGWFYLRIFQQPFKVVLSSNSTLL